MISPRGGGGGGVRDGGFDFARGLRASPSSAATSTRNSTLSTVHHGKCSADYPGWFMRGPFDAIHTFHLKLTTTPPPLRHTGGIESETLSHPCQDPSYDGVDPNSAYSWLSVGGWTYTQADGCTVSKHALTCSPVRIGADGKHQTGRTERSVPATSHRRRRVILAQNGPQCLMDG